MRIDQAAGYGPLEQFARHLIRFERIRAHWPEMLRVAGSLTASQVRAYDLIRMTSRDGRPTGLGGAFAHYGRIFKTLHIRQILHDESHRRMIASQQNLRESRHGSPGGSTTASTGSYASATAKGWRTSSARSRSS